MVGDLRQQAQLDLEMTIKSDFGQKMRISTPDGKTFKDLIGITNDIHMAIDPETGQIVSGQTAHATLLIKDLMDEFGELPEKRWICEFIDIGPGEFRVKNPPQPDKTLGIVLLTLGN